MDLDSIKTSLSALLAGITDPDQIKVITESIKGIDEAKEEHDRQDAVITRQAGDLKRFYLNDARPTTAAPEPPVEQTEAPAAPRSLEEIISDVISRRSK